MADKKPNPSDLYMQDFLRGMRTGQIGSKLPEDSLATTQLESDQIRNLAQDQVTLGQRDLGDYLQDIGTGLMGTFGAIGNTAILGVAAAGDGLERLVTGESDWEATQQALELMNSTSQYWNSMQSVKSDAFDRITQYRQDRAIEQANAEALAETGENANWLRRQGAAFSAAAGSYLSNPDQIVTDGIAQLPYLLTGGVAKAATAAVPRAGALLARMVGKGMSVEAAEKAIQMGIVGGLQGTIEGADAASSAYDRVMRSTDTFGPEEQAARESAALEAAAKAFGIAGITSAVTGTLASKFELSPFSALGKNAAARSGDNLIKALLEGAQETIESGTSQFAANYGGNTVLRGKDRVALDEGVGGAAGQGLVVGAGSTVITNPRSGVDAAIAPLVLAGKPFSYMADRAVKAERKEDMAAANANASDIIANITTPAAVAAVDAKLAEATNLNASVDIAPENVVLPPEMLPRTTDGPIGQAIRTFATGMEYLRGKDMNSTDAVDSFHVLGAVLANANNIRSLRDGVARDAVDTNLAPEDQEKAKKTLVQLDGMLDSNLLDKWVADYPMEDIEGDLESLRQNPEAFGSVIAHLAERNPLRMTPKLIETALEAKSLPKPQRDALLLAQELKAAAADLKVTGKPDSAEVKRSMMQTGFPGYRENDSVAGYVSRVTAALAENDQATAQTEFHRLVKFANFEQGRAAAYEAAKDQMAKDPDSKRIELDGYYQLNEFGKLDKSKPQFVDKKALGLVKTVRSDADAIQKMVTLLAKRTGLKAVEAAPTEAPVAVSKPVPTKTVTESKPKVEKPAAAPESPKVAPKPVVSRITPEQAQRLSQKGLEDRITAIYVKGEEQTAEDKATFLILADERTRREAELPAETEEDVVEIDEPGREVATGTGTIQLNAGQAAAYDKVLGFLRNTSARTFSIIGSAGTGKTTLINAVLAEVRKDPSLKNKKIILTSPTHRANAVIRSKNPGEKILTLHKLLGLKPTVDIENFDAKKLEFAAEGSDSELGENTVLIVDESSMINDGLFKYLQQTLSATPGLQIIFMGDTAQLGPVKQNTDSKALTGTEDQAELTKVMRAKNAALLDESIHVRQEGDFSNKKNMDKGEGVNFTNTVSGFIQHAVKLYQSDAFVKNPLLLRVVAATNQAVTDFNKAIRSSLFGSDDAPLQKGELLMGYASFGRANADGTTAISNGVDYIIQSVGRPATVRVLGVPMQVSNATIKDVFGGPATTVPIILPENTPEAFAALEVALQDLLDRARKDRRLWKEFYAFKDMYVILQDLRNPDNRSRTLVSKTMDYGYAHTIHKSQGGTYRYAFVDEASIQKFPSQKDQERLRYVGLTRAEVGAFVYTTGAITQGKAKKASASVVQTPKVVDKSVVKKAEPAPVVAAPVSNESRITPEQAQQLSFKGLQARVDAITKKGIQNTTKEDDSTLAVLNEELDRRAEEALRRDEDNENPEPSDIDDNFEEPAAAEAVVEVVKEPSKNHFEGLMPSYPVAEGASVAEQNDAKNHLSQSFTPSGKPGLVSKGMDVLTQKQALLDELGVNDNEEATQTVLSTMGLVQTLFVRMNELLKTKHSPLTVKTFLKGRNSWRLRDARYLYATIWGNEGQIKYQKNIATVMAWTGVQHMLDMVIPVSWSNDAVQKFVKTYGEDIQEMLADGWIPLPEQMHDIAKKLRINLELKADPNISPTYTDGTMLALAGNIVESMLNRPDFNGVMDHRTMFMLDKDGNKSKIQVQWVKMSVGNKNLLFDTARLFDKFFVEDGPKGLAHIGKPPTNVNPFYRNSLQKIGKEQSAALKKMNNTWYKLSPLMYGMWNALPTADHAWRLFGMRPVVVPEGEKPSLAQIEQKGANNTLWADLKTIAGHIKRLEDHVAAQEEETDIHDVKSFFEHEHLVNGRASPKGISVQSSKAYREFVTVAQYTVDPTKENKGFRMAVAQGLGIKMDVQAIEDSLDKLDILLADSRIKRALEAALRLGNGHPYAAKEDDLLEADLQAMEALSDPEGLGIELSPHAIAALLHQAKYQEAKGKGETFTSALMYEIDGKTDGPINLMMLMGLRGSLEEMTPFLGLAGLFFADSPTAVQDMTQQLKDWHKGSKDLYEIMAANAAEITNGNRQEMLDNILKHTDPKYHADTTYGTKELMRSITYLLNLANLSNSNVASILADYKRAFTKKPAQAAGYLQEILSVSGDLLNTMLVELSKLHDSSKLEDADYAHIDKFFSSAFGSSGGKIYYNGKPSAYAGLEWAGKPLTRAQWNTARATLTQFGAGGLFGGVVKTIGYQRAQMEAAAAVMNQRVAYAQHVLRKMYLEKQEAEVKAGNLLPNQPLPKITESAIVNEVWKTVIPHPMLRNTAGLPVAKIVRGIGNELLGSSERDKDGRIQNNFFVDSKGNPEFRQYTDPVEAAIQDLGVSFAALSIMAAGDGSMMTGYFSKTKRNVQNMFDGMYMNPEEIDDVGFEINGEVKENWEHDFIGAILDSVQAVDNDDFRAWLEPQKDGKLYANYLSNLKGLARQRDNQTRLRKEINAKDHYISHMAGHGNPNKTVGTPLNSTTLGTSVTDPLLDLAADELGHEINGIRKMSAADIKSLLNNHTFENPVLKGLWNMLSPLINDNLVLFMSSDKQGLADFYQQNERREMGSNVNGISIGDRVYVRTINAETIVHELLHATTKNLTATYFANPTSLTPQQREAMKDLKALANEFEKLDPETLPVSQAAMVEHVQVIMRGYVAKGDLNSAMQEFLAYSLTNYWVQRTLGATKSRLGELLDSVFAAIKKMFGFPNGNQSDSMLAHLLSNFEALTDQATNVAYPISVENALESVNLDLARSFGSVLNRLVYADALQAVTDETQGQAGTATTRLAARDKARTRLASIKDLARTRMQELADTNLFPAMTDEQQAAGEYLQALFAASLQLKATDNALLARVVDAVRDAGPKAWRTNGDPHDQTDIGLAQARYDFFFRGATSDHDQAADILAMSQVNPEFAAYLNKIILPQQDIQKGSLNNWLDSLAKFLYDKMDTGLALRKGATLDDALDVATLRIQKSLQASAKRNEAKSNAYRNFTNKLSQGVQYIGEMAGKTAEARLKLKSNKDWITSGLMILAGTANDQYADMLGNLTLSLTNQLSAKNPAADLIQEMVGTTSDNYRLIQLKGLAARMVSAIRQTFREQVPVAVKSWFKDLSPEQDELLHTVIGKAAVYSLSKDLKNRMEELLTNPTNAKLEAERLLSNGGDRTKRLLMIKYAKHLGDRMANRGNQALYMNTRAIAGLAIHGGGEKLSTAEYAALENLSTLQALSHLTPLQRRQMLNLYRENTEGFWKTAALINAFHDFDTQRAGSDTATLNFQKGYIPVESDSRKKVKLFQKSEVRKAERMGWVQVGEFADNPNMIYMATTVGKTPTLSGGAIHAVDMHMNGIHFHTGMPTDPSIQTVISHPKAVADIRARILNGENMPYTILYDAEGDVEGFQRVLDPAIVERHTKTVGRISDAAGIWLGRLHEERVAHGQNQAAADLLRKTWDQGKADKREHEFINIRQPIDLKDPNPKQDKVLANVWKTLPYHTKVQLETAFADGSTNPPIWVRRDQLHDAIGYHKASVGNFFTGDNRYNSATNTNVAALARQFLGKNAYKYLVMGEEGWQAVVGAAKDTIIVKSLVVALNNLGSNQLQLFMITGNPLWNLRVQSQKHKELVSYLGYQQRDARLTAELLATNDPKALAKITAEQKFLQGEMRKLSIWPLIESGELPTIAEGLSETEEFSMVGDLTDWIEKQVGKLPPTAMTVLNNLVVSKETSLYKGLDRMVQYGDFVAKATMYEWLTTKDANAKKEALALMAKDSFKKLTYTDALHTAALMEVNDEFVNYTRLPGRWRTYGEDMGLMWFYNYKLRILKIAFRRIRKNPAAFLIGAGVGNALGLATLMDSLPWNTNFSYSIGVDPLLSAHETIIWNQML